MFENLSQRLTAAVGSLTGKGRLTEQNIKDTLRQLRMALLEADVALPVVKTFVEDIRERAVGTELQRSLTPGQALTRIVHEELTRIMGEESRGLELRVQPPAVLLLAGLQGAGKTTTAAKLARMLIRRDKKKVLLASVDVHRPAAILQLERLAGEVGAQFFPCDAQQEACDIARAAVSAARRGLIDVLLIDTAGRLHVDEAMMAELCRVHAAVTPVETLFVVDAMTGQDAVNAARAFDEALPLTGVILTKADGDARGGAALSVRQVTGKPIKFLGVGEKTDALEPFHPQRIASRILGMGDVLSLVEEVEQKVDKERATRLIGRLKKGRGFTLEDMRDQLQQMIEMGGVGALLDKLPAGASVPEAVRAQHGDRELRRQIAIICSMTTQERRRPKLVNSSRKRRIAAGSGVAVQEVNRLLKQFTRTEKMMRKIGGGGMRKALRALGGRPPPARRR